MSACQSRISFVTVLRFSSVGSSSPSGMSSTCVVDAEDLGRRLDLGLAALRQRLLADLPVADVAVGDRHELDVVPGLRPLDRGAAGLELGVVRVGPEDDDPQLAVVRRVGGGGR